MIPFDASNADVVTNTLWEFQQNPLIPGKPDYTLGEAGQLHDKYGRCLGAVLITGETYNYEDAANNQVTIMQNVPCIDVSNPNALTEE